MNKKQVINLELRNIGDKQYIYIKDYDQYRSADLLVNYLNSCKKSKEIINGNKIYEGEVTKYKYDIKSSDIEDKSKYSVVVEVKRDEKQYFYESIKYMDSLCDLSAVIKKVNRARLAAGIFAGAFIMIAAGPSIIKNYKNNNEAKNQYQQELYQEYLNNLNKSDHYEATDSEKQQAEDVYYESLKQRAESGDQAAIKEYQDYILEQLLIEQSEQSSKTR